MKHQKFFLPLAAVLGVSSGLNPACAADDPWPYQHRFGLSYRMGFNISTRFQNLSGGPAFANNPSVTGVSYQDGFVGTDSSGNAGGLTTYWGYSGAGQVQDANAVLTMRSANAGAIGRSVDPGPLHGLELTYNHELGRNDKVRWGIEVAFNWADFSADQRAIAPAGVITVDAFPLGYTPPQPPYIGPAASGPFIPVLGVTPTRLPVTVASHLEAALYGFRLGPYLDVPLGQRVLLTLGAGLAVTVVEGEYAFLESFTTPGGATVTTPGRASQTSAVLGGFLGAQASVKLGKHVNLFTGLQYQGGDSYRIRASDKQAEIDFSGALYWSCGLSFGF